MQPTPDFPTPRPPRKPLHTALVTGYFVATTGYLLYSSLTQTGLCGWLISWQISLFGSASEGATIGGATLLLLLPTLLLAGIVRRRAGPAAEGQSTLSPDNPPKGLTLKGLMLMAAVPTLLALPAYFWLKTQADRDSQRPVYQLDFINQPAAPVPASAKFVMVQGVAQTQFQYILEETRYSKVEKTDRYLPLTGPDWRPGQPVQLLWDTSVDMYYDPAAQAPADLDHASAFPGTFRGELSQRLPTVVRQYFEHQGLKLAEPVYVLREKYFANGRPVDYESSTYYLIPWVGLGLSAALLVGGGLGLAIRRARGL